jgi:hypothetical protein
MINAFRWWLCKRLNVVTWWICPEPHRTNLGRIFQVQWDDANRSGLVERMAEEEMAKLLGNRRTQDQAMIDILVKKTQAGGMYAKND